MLRSHPSLDRHVATTTIGRTRHPRTDRTCWNHPWTDQMRRQAPQDRQNIYMLETPLDRSNVLTNIPGQTEKCPGHIEKHPKTDQAVQESWSRPFSITRLRLVSCAIS